MIVVSKSEQAWCCWCNTEIPTTDNISVRMRDQRINTTQLGRLDRQGLFLNRQPDLVY